MANKKQSLKYIRKTETRTNHNRSIRSRLKTLSRKVENLAESDDQDARKAAAREMVSAYEKAAKSGIVHPNKVNRKKAAVSSYLG